MNFDFTDEQKQFAEQVRRFAREHLARDALKRAHNPRFPFDAAAIIAKQGLMGITLPHRLCADPSMYGAAYLHRPPMCGPAAYLLRPPIADPPMC